MVRGLITCITSHLSSCGAIVCQLPLVFFSVSSSIIQPSNDFQGVADTITNYDESVTSLKRRKLLNTLIGKSDYVAIARKVGTSSVVGYGILRCIAGDWHLKPVYANSPDVAKKIFEILLQKVPNGGELTVFPATDKVNLICDWCTEDFSCQLAVSHDDNKKKEHAILFTKHPLQTKNECIYSIWDIEYSLA